MIYPEQSRLLIIGYRIFRQMRQELNVFPASGVRRLPPLFSFLSFFLESYSRSSDRRAASPLPLFFPSHPAPSRYLTCRCRRRRRVAATRHVSDERISTDRNISTLVSTGGPNWVTECINARDSITRQMRWIWVPCAERCE